MSWMDQTPEQWRDHHARYDRVTWRNEAEQRRALAEGLRDQAINRVISGDDDLSTSGQAHLLFKGAKTLEASAELYERYGWF